MSVRPQAKDKPSAASFKWDDPFLLDEQLTEDERMIRDTARAYAQEKLLPRVIKAYLEEKTDREIFNEMGELGLIGVTLPEEYGCANASYVAYGLVAREIEAVDSGYRSAMSVQASLVLYPILEFGSDAQKARWLEPLARGEAASGSWRLPRPSAIQNSARVGARRMMANSQAVTRCGCSPVTSAARLEKPPPMRPPMPVGSGQLAGAGRKARTPVARPVAAIQVMRRSTIRAGTRRRKKLQPQTASGISSTMMPRPSTWKLRSAMTAPGNPSQFATGLVVA